MEQRPSFLQDSCTLLGSKWRLLSYCPVSVVNPRSQLLSSYTFKALAVGSLLLCPLPWPPCLGRPRILQSRKGWALIHPVEEAVSWESQSGYRQDYCPLSMWTYCLLHHPLLDLSGSKSPDFQVPWVPEAS